MNIADKYKWKERIEVLGVSRARIAREAGVHDMTLYFLVHGIRKNGRTDTVASIEKTIRKLERKKRIAN
jgi:predicted transcriptional regulator